MNAENLYSIKEVAEKLGISQQAVYKKLNDTLKDYVVVLDRKKYIRAEYFNNSTFSTNSTNLSTSDSTNSTNQVESVEKVDTTSIFHELLKEKDETISTLQVELIELKKAINEKDKLIADYAFRFAELASQSQQIASQAQVLVSQSQTLQALDEHKEKEKKSFWKLFFRK